jgi:hypothetical protein
METGRTLFSDVHCTVLDPEVDTEEMYIINISGSITTWEVRFQPIGAGNKRSQPIRR